MSIEKPWSLRAQIVFEAAKKARQPSDLVSVCVTVFNYEEFLTACLDSIAAQTYENLELIIVDDKSERDDSLAVATAWAEQTAGRFHRVCVLSHSRNQGPAAARNSAFLRAAAKTVFIIDADNEVYPRCIARLVNAMRDGDFDATYTQLEYFGDERKIGSADLWDPVVMAYENYVDVMGLIKNSAWEHVGGFSPIEEGWEDYDF